MHVDAKYNAQPILNLNQIVNGLVQLKFFTHQINTLGVHHEYK